MTAGVAPRLIVITDAGRGAVETMLETLERLSAQARPGSVLVQLRDRQLSTSERRRLGDVLRAITRRHGQLLSINDRLDLAVLLAADGVHLGESSVALPDARAFGAAHGQTWFISAACHAPERFEQAREDALLLSPVAAERKGRPALGLAGLRAALEHRGKRQAGLGPCALFVLGGMTRFNARDWCERGADGIALMGELFQPDVVPGLLAALAVER